uniref:C2H2-type domain-containing protein n=1 Tax=Oryzias sinensis TaxID=183150 RepID=A0A8C7X189_9TELE
MIKEDTTEDKTEQNIPLILHEIDLKSCTAFNEVEEQTEPLDLSLPKKRESRERRGGGFLDEQYCESSLIMEVDEYEGDGDRDMVEEDEDEDSELRLSGTDTPGEPLQSPSVLSADVLSPLPSEDCDTKNILLIDDQGIPYTLSQDGIKVPLGSRRVLCCQLCPRIFFYLSDLERHAITHSQKKPHVCQQCGKAFKRSSHLQRHKHIHTGQRNFVCSICTKRFREAGELQRHQRVHTGEKPYQCQLCHTRFAERNTLRRHTKRKHPYHQVALEMLNKRKDKGGNAGEAGGKAGVQEEEESAEWYSSTVSTLEKSESETES